STSASIRPASTATGRIPTAPTSTGSSGTAAGSVTSQNGSTPIRASLPTPRTTASASRCPTDRAVRRAGTAPISSPVDDGRDGGLNLVLEVKGFRDHDAMLKATTMHTQWIPGVNRLGRFGTWAFAELREIHDFGAALDQAITDACGETTP